MFFQKLIQPYLILETDFQLIRKPLNYKNCLKHIILLHKLV